MASPWPVFVACAAVKQRLKRDNRDDDWANWLLVGARDPNCLDADTGNALAAWGRGQPGWTDAVGEWDAGHGLYVDVATLSPSSRLRVALTGTDAGAVLAAAHVALGGDPNDTFARAVLAREQLRLGELTEAIATATPPDTPELARLRATALDDAGFFEEAVAAYADAGLGLHAAAILYQSLGRQAEAEGYLDEPVPPVAIHRGWMALLAGLPLQAAGLDQGPESLLLRGIAGERVDLAAVPGPEAAAALALSTGTTSALWPHVARHPHAEVLRRAEILALARHGLDSGAARAEWAALDPSTVLLAGNPARREAPWAAVVPGDWSSLPAVPPPSGADEIGDAWRAALAEPTAEARDRALAHLQADHPELRGLARVRAQVAAGFLDTEQLLALDAGARQGRPGMPYAVPGARSAAAPP